MALEATGSAWRPQMGTRTPPEAPGGSGGAGRGVCPSCSEWYGTLEWHCASCCRGFATREAFDRHRVVPPLRRLPWWEDALLADPPGYQPRCR